MAISFLTTLCHLVKNNPPSKTRTNVREQIMKLTKNDMARVIIQALYNLPALPAADHNLVVRRTKRNSKTALEYQHGLAVKVLQQKVATS